MYGAVGLSWQQRGPPGPLLRVYRVRIQNFGVGVLWWLQVPYIHALRVQVAPHSLTRKP